MEVALWVAGWLFVGALVYYWPWPGGKSLWDGTVGEFLLILAFGPLFLPLMILGWIAGLKMPKRRAPREKPQPRWQQEAEREVDSWLRR